MRHFMYFILLSTFLSCKEKSYFGYVCNNQKHPIEKVQIVSFPGEIKTYTNKNGYYSLPKITNISASLIFIKAGYTIDTIPAYAGSESLYANFQGDTIYLQSIKGIK